jgi:hypothetical protein
MTLTLAVSLVICIVGLLIYWFATHPKIQALALHMFWVGLLACLIRWSGTLSIH